MDMRKALGGSHFKAIDCDPPLTCYISGVSDKEIEDNGALKIKYLVHFKDQEKTLMLNGINTQSLIDVLGNDSNFWTGCKCQLYKTQTEFQGKMVDCVRIREVRQSPEMAEKSAAPKEEWVSPPTEESSEIPF